MHFTRLRLSGFKSFVDATELVIEPGVTGIVGPNGCGKSNLVEALRWVMGETSAKRMRGDDMDDVIFGGTSNRPARNLAEVTLALDNRSHTAPAGFNDAEDLEVTRRIERGSGSDYRINGKLVRARDVQLLFADNASGANSPALVSQGKVGQIINAKPQDRRMLLEEAAGITGLHSRRHEAELRLKAAETNLTRLDDVIGAMDTQLAGLKKQAKQAARYRTLSEQIRKAEAVLWHLRWIAAQAENERARTAFTRAESQVAELMLAVTQLTTRRTGRWPSASSRSCRGRRRPSRQASGRSRRRGRAPAPRHRPRAVGRRGEARRRRAIRPPAAPAPDRGRPGPRGGAGRRRRRGARPP